MILTLALAALAHADTIAGVAAPCMASAPTASQPANGATGVPMDVVPGVFFSTTACGAGGTWSIGLYTAAGDQVAYAEDDTSDGLAELDPGVELEANTDYVLRVDPLDGSAAESDITFTTGEGDTMPIGIVPEVVRVEPSWTSETDLVTVSAVVQYGDRAGADLFAIWTDGPEKGDDRAAQTRLDAAGETADGEWPSQISRSRQPSGWCVSASTREMNGEVNVGEEVCADVADASPGMILCSTSGGTASLAGLVGVGLALARRRR